MISPDFEHNLIRSKLIFNLFDSSCLSDLPPIVSAIFRGKSNRLLSFKFGKVALGGWFPIRRLAAMATHMHAFRAVGGDIENEQINRGCNDSHTGDGHAVRLCRT